MISLKSVRHRYNSFTTVELPDINLIPGSDLLLLGLSGSGKSTLIHILAGLLKPTEGSYTLLGTDLYELNEPERDQYRGKNIGVIFQQMHLISTLNIFENLKLAQYLAGLKPNSEMIEQLCADLDVADKLQSFPDELSQGQKQRASIARAVVNKPVLLLADEPTSSLDDLRSNDVILLLKEQAEKNEATLIISTHDQRVKSHFNNIVDIDKIQKEVV
ncbi:MAG: ATP-binding cassette domain-containing protein [Balneolaceae bacterium]|nr:MAG: ATP-binding cassette domain-containing protein [Balneolaceae bacterium]